MATAGYSATDMTERKLGLGARVVSSRAQQGASRPHRQGCSTCQPADRPSVSSSPDSLRYGLRKWVQRVLPLWAVLHQASGLRTQTHTLSLALCPISQTHRAVIICLCWVPIDFSGLMQRWTLEQYLTSTVTSMVAGLCHARSSTAAACQEEVSGTSFYSWVHCAGLALQQCGDIRHPPCGSATTLHTPGQSTCIYLPMCVGQEQGRCEHPGALIGRVKLPSNPPSSPQSLCLAPAPLGEGIPAPLSRPHWRLPTIIE